MRLKHNNKLKIKPAKRNIGFSKMLALSAEKMSRVIFYEMDIDNNLVTCFFI
jgi:hypothetical protein